MSSCRTSSCCVDAREPVRASYKVLYRWPESDVEFVKSVAAAERRGGDRRAAAAAEDPGGEEEERRRRRQSVPVVDGFSCRQMYLRSYTFTTRKETVPEKTRRRLKTALTRTRSSEEEEEVKSRRRKKKNKSGKKKVEDCEGPRRLRAALQAALRRIFFCSGAVGVVDYK